VVGQLPTPARLFETDRGRKWMATIISSPALKKLNA
jgi:hypothetical protein